VHRDLKPSNVLVMERDGQPVAKVIDFGIAKARGELGGLDPAVTSWTAEGVPCPGTPAYMSPEQAARMAGQGPRVITAADGSTQPAIDHRCDVYSLGSMLYELLAGVTPFDPAMLKELTQAELLRVIREVDPPPPSRRVASWDPATLVERAAQRGIAPEGWASLLRRELDWIALRALEKDRARRYDSAADLGLDIERYLRGERVHACPASWTYRVSKAARQHRTRLTSAAVAALCLAGGLWVGWQRAASRPGEIASTPAPSVSPASRPVAPALDPAHAVESPGTEKQLEPATETTAAPIETHFGQALIRAWRARDNGDLDAARAAVAEAVEHARGLGAGSGDQPLPFSLRYLQTLVSDPVRELSARQHPLLAASVSPDGQQVVTSDRDGRLNVWGLPAGRIAHSFRYQGIGDAKREVTKVAFSPDGTRLATGGVDPQLRVFRTGDWQEQGLLRGHEGTITGLQWSPDGRMLLSCSRDDTVRVWDAETGQELRQLLAADSPVHAGDGTLRNVAWSPDGRFVAAGIDQQVLVWSTRDWQPLPSLPLAGGNILCLAFHPTQPWLAVAGYFDELLLYDVSTSQLQARAASASIHWSVLFSPDGNLLLAGGASGGPSVWQVSSPGHPLHQLRGRFYQSGYQRALLLPRDGRTLVTVSEQDQMIRVQEFERALGWRSLTSADEFVGVASPGDTDANNAGTSDTRLSPRVITLSSTQVPQVLDVETGEVRPLTGTERLEGGYVRHGDLEVACVPGGVVRARSRRDGRVLWEHAGLTLPPYEMAVSADGRWLMGASSERGVGRMVYLWHANTGQLVRQFDGHTRATFSPDGRTLAMLGVNRRDIVLWDPAGDRLERTMEAAGDEEFHSLVFTPDGRRILAGASVSGVVEWDVASGRQLRQLPGPRGRVTNLALHPDGKTLVTTSSDWTSRLWHLPSGQELCTILQHHADQHHHGERHWIQFADADTLLISSTRDASGQQTLFILEATK